MKKVLVIIAAVAALGIGSVASAHMYGTGSGYGYGGHMMGYGYGPMMGYGYGPMMGYGYGYGTADSKTLEKTADLRRQLNDKQFEYSEALRTGDEKTAETLAKEIDELSAKIGTATPASTYTARGGFGPGSFCW